MNILKTSRTNREKAAYLLKMVSELEEVLNRLTGAAPLFDLPADQETLSPPAPDTVAEALYNTADSLDKTNEHLERMLNFLQNEVLHEVKAVDASVIAEGPLARPLMAPRKPAHSAFRDDMVSAVARELNPERI